MLKITSTERCFMGSISFKRALSGEAGGIDARGKIYKLRENKNVYEYFFQFEITAPAKVPLELNYFVLLYRNV
jgi:hypothetical protein